MYKVEAINFDKNKAQPRIYRVITNVYKRGWHYHIIGTILVCAILASCAVISQYLSFAKKEKENAFIDGIEESVGRLVVNELDLMLNKLSDLEMLQVTKNYSQTKRKVFNFFFVGSVLYVDRGANSTTFDLYPLIILLQSILEEDFHYKVALGNKTLASNIEDKKFSYVRTLKSNEGVEVTISLTPKQSAAFAQKYYKSLRAQKILGVMLSLVVLGLSFTLAIWGFFLITKHKIICNSLNKLKKGWELHTEYIKLYSNSEGGEKELAPPNILSPNNELDVLELINEIEIYALSYTTRYYYKFELIIISFIEVVKPSFSDLVFKQLIVSLLHNILYFMRGGTHIKRFLIEFNHDNITFVYDSFAANEDHMCAWSHDLSNHLGTPYILESTKIFHIINSYGLEYKIEPQQGKNKVAIFYKNQEKQGRVLQFKKTT